MPTLTFPETKEVKKVFQSEVALDFAAALPCPMMDDADGDERVALEYARTIWSDAKPIAQFEDRFFRYCGAVAESATETKTSSGAPAAIWFASAKEPPDFTGATGTPALWENALRRAVVSIV
jgi:hypothetical protein